MPDICIVSDGKPGHLNQSLGLTEALIRVNPLLTYEVRPSASLLQLIKLLLIRLTTTPEPSNIKIFIGAGHQTHLSLLLYGKLLGVSKGVKNIVMMTPSFPLRWFDLCFIPEHDQPETLSNVVETWGALNRMVPSVKKECTGLILLGGASKHCLWDDSHVLEQLEMLVEADNEVTEWVLTTSRRTPHSILEKLPSKVLPIKIIPFEDTDAEWLPERLAEVEKCWVTEDSVSMVYEALTAGCRVGLIELEASSKKSNRVARGISRLRASGRVITLRENSWSGGDLPLPLSEADRCASLIIQKGWL